ncbi:hypothetical protein MD484_g7229, partial [Candolleomyces efflorescens]
MSPSMSEQTELMATGTRTGESQTAGRLVKTFGKMPQLKDPKDKYAIRQMINQHRSAILHIDIELASKSTRPHRESLKYERSEHMQALEDYCRLLRPIEKLPPEILRIVFLHSLPHIDESSPEVCPTDAPHVLLGVCKRWNIIASDYPRLWNRIVIKIPYLRQDGISLMAWFSRKETKADKLADAYRLWISRSRNLPLYIYLDDWSSLKGWESQSAYSALRNFFVNILPLSVHRWKEVCGSVRAGSWLFNHIFNSDLDSFLPRNAVHQPGEATEGGSVVSNPLQAHADSLEKGSVAGNEEPGKKKELTLTRIAVTFGFWPANLDVFRCAPGGSQSTLWSSQRLRALELPNMPLIKSIRRVLPYWSTLTTLSKVVATPLEVYHVLKECPSLEVASFACPAFREAYEYRPREHKFKERRALLKSQRIETKVLTKVSFCNYPPILLNPLCEAVDFIALSDLTLLNTRCNHLAMFKCYRLPYRILLDRGSRLKRVHLEQICISKTHMISYLREFENVTHLTILFPGVGATHGGKFHYHKGYFDASLLEMVTPAIPSNPTPGDSVDSSSAEETVESENLLLPKLTSFTCDFLSSLPLVNAIIYHFCWNNKNSKLMEDGNPRFTEEGILKFIQARRSPHSTVLGIAVLEKLEFKCQVVTTDPNPEPKPEGARYSTGCNRWIPRRDPTVKDLVNVLWDDQESQVDVDGLRAIGSFRYMYVSPEELEDALGKPETDNEEHDGDDGGYRSYFRTVPGGSIVTDEIEQPEGSDWGESETDVYAYRRDTEYEIERNQGVDSSETEDEEDEEGDQAANASKTEDEGDENGDQGDNTSETENEDEGASHPQGQGTQETEASGVESQGAQEAGPEAESQVSLGSGDDNQSEDENEDCDDDEDSSEGEYECSDADDEASESDDDDDDDWWWLF